MNDTICPVQLSRRAVQRASGAQNLGCHDIQKAYSPFLLVLSSCFGTNDTRYKIGVTPFLLRETFEKCSILFKVKEDEIQPQEYIEYFED